MKYFIPQLALKTLLPPQTRLEEKLGGLPWGLKADLWPRCRECGKPQTLLAQFIHQTGRLDLKKEGRHLLIFWCAGPDGCETWKKESGANACLVLDDSEITDGLTLPPSPDTLVQVEARVTGWHEQDDDLPESPATLFSVEQLGTRLGGPPFWAESAGVPPKFIAEGWQFLGQLGSSYHFDGPPPSSDRVGCAIARWVDKQKIEEKATQLKPDAPERIYVPEGVHYWWCDGPGFGDSGTGYFFVKYPPGKPKICFFWQSS